ncbi:general substrate transporter [Meira miltonrushii]|uniref:General substrate transporter n=1 Tax=Meira miltonrushii TaxID=1280837 RepID=A0A316VDR1_9BASI|nr:general substrate transporter [Meira miltonrushii]PWN34141.1 general substrate transporter [Meira miltonrushii]
MSRTTSVLESSASAVELQRLGRDDQSTTNQTHNKSLWRDSWLARPIIIKALPPQARLIMIGAIVSISGLLYGLDTGSIGPVTEMDQFYKTIGFIPSPALHGFFVASILLSASISSLCSGFVADKISRRFGVFTGAVIFTIGATISASCSAFPALIVARLITGIGAGQMIAVASIYLIEIATSETRGKLACMIQFCIAIGIMTGYFITYATQRISSSLSWRLPFIVQASTSALLALLIIAFVPFSPRWQAQHHGEQAALDTLRKIRLPDFETTSRSGNETLQSLQESQLQKEILEIRAAITEARICRNSARRGSSAGASSYKELFHRRYRKRTALGIFLMSAQQLSGVDVVLYFAPVVFSSLFSSQTASFLASGVSGIILVVSTIPAQIYVDRWGRKPMMVGGGISMAACFLIIGSLFAKFASIENNTVRLAQGPARWVVVVLIYLFLAIFSMTWAVVCRIYAAEVMPTRLRSKAAAGQQLANWTTNFVVALTAPSFLRATPSGPYFFFSACIAFTTLICFKFMIETKGRSLEQIDNLFDQHNE